MDLVEPCAECKFACVECGKVFGSYKKYEVHWTGTHSELLPCPYCDIRFGVRGLERHKARCQVDKETRSLVVTAEAVRAKAVDFFTAVRELPDQAGSLVLIPRDGPPLVIRDRMLAETVGTGAYMFRLGLVDPAAVRAAERRRDRRKSGPTELTKKVGAPEKGLPGT